MTAHYTTALARRVNRRAGGGLEENGSIQELGGTKLAPCCGPSPGEGKSLLGCSDLNRTERLGRGGGEEGRKD